MKKVHTNKGFTMAELLIVVAIIAVLVAVAIPAFATQLEKSRQAVDISSLRNAYATARLAEMNGKFDKDTKLFTASDNTNAFEPDVTTNTNKYVSKIATLGDTAPTTVKIIQYWYNPETEAFTVITPAEAATAEYALAKSTGNSPAVKVGKATASALYADTDGLSSIIVYDATTTLAATTAASSAVEGKPTGKTGTTEKGILVTFEQNAGGIFKLVEVTFREQAYAKKAA